MRKEQGKSKAASFIQATVSGVPETLSIKFDESS